MLYTKRTQSVHTLYIHLSAKLPVSKPNWKNEAIASTTRTIEDVCPSTDTGSEHKYGHDGWNGQSYYWTVLKCSELDCRIATLSARVT